MAHSTRGTSAAKSPTDPQSVVGYNRARGRKKARKPAFPLWLHPTGQWAKKIRGRYFYFGTDKDAALKEYLRVKEDREAGRTPPPADGEQITLMQLCNHFLTHKKHQRDVGEITARTFDDYYSSCERILKRLGKSTVVDQIRPGDLMAYRRTLGAKRNATSLGNEVARVRTLLSFAFHAGLIDRPVRFGEFKKPSKRVARRQRAAAGSRMFEPAEIKSLLDEASPQLKAMILLAVNCGFGNADCATLPIDAVDLDEGWVDHPRLKTGIPRRCPLWAETVDALQVVLANRKEPSDEKHARLIFVTKYGGAWYRDGKPSGAITHEFRKLLDNLDLYRPGLSFYSARHTFQTIGDETGDYLAVRRIMGHADNSISDAYRERFPDERLQRVVEHVHGWLFGKGVAC